MSFKINTLAALTLALAAFAQPASAAENLDRAQRSVTISYADLNLASAAGGMELYKRINHAAETACGPMPAGVVVYLYPLAQRHYKKCVHQAVDNAVAGLDNPMVTALHNGQALPITVAENVR